MQRASRKQAREVKREIKAFQYRAKGQGEKERARRVSAMVNEQLKAENGVIPQYDEYAGETSVETKKAVAEHFLHGPVDLSRYVVNREKPDDDE